MHEKDNYHRQNRGGEKSRGFGRGHLRAADVITAVCQEDCLPAWVAPSIGATKLAYGPTTAMPKGAHQQPEGCATVPAPGLPGGFGM